MNFKLDLPQEYIEAIGQGLEELRGRIGNPITAEIKRQLEPQFEALRVAKAEADKATAAKAKKGEAKAAKLKAKKIKKLKKK